MKRAHRFPTGSRFDGSMNELLFQMDGFGVYVFPDGSEYRGYFRNGRFHGYGRLKLSSPYKFMFKGNFEMGKLLEIESMVFGDGLHINGTFDETGMNCEDWSYLTEHDRRYSTEILNGLEAVGPNSLKTRQRQMRRLPRDTYDTEEGIYRPSNGFVTDRPPPFKRLRFVSCKKEVDFIRMHYRRGPARNEHGGHAQPIEPNGAFCRHIIETNITALAKLGENIPSCACNEDIERRQYLPKFDKPVHGSSKDDDSTEMPLTPSSSTDDSFSDNSMVEDMEHNIWNELIKLKIPRRCAEVEEGEDIIMERRHTTIGFNTGSNKFGAIAF